MVAEEVDAPFAVDDAATAELFALEETATTAAADDLTADDEVMAEEDLAEEEMTTEEAVDVLAGAAMVVVGVLVVQPHPKPKKQKVLLSR